VYRDQNRSLNLKWLTPGAKAFAPLPHDLLRLPREEKR